jgi:diguanylate cyclase (GGDEF)-like protein
MPSPKQKLFAYVNNNPTRFPIIVSVGGIFIATLSAAMFVQAGLHHNGLMVIWLAFGLSTGIAGPAGYIYYTRERQLARQQKQLRKLASTDTLTGVLNRRTFEQAVHNEQLRMRRSGQQSALIVFDLDWFKSINDTFGHAAGDSVLKAVATKAKAELRHPVDAVSRWGGEEFAIFLAGVSASQAVDIAERLRETLVNLALDHIAPGLSVTASFGVRSMSAGCSLKEALIDADRALYTAKNAGRNQVVTASVDESSPFATHAAAS